MFRTLILKKVSKPLNVLKYSLRGFPGGSVMRSPPANRTPCGPRGCACCRTVRPGAQLPPCALDSGPPPPKPSALEPELPNKRSPRWRPPRREALTRGAPAARGPRATARRARRESSPSSKEPAQPKQNHTQKHKRIACGTFQLLLSSLVCLLDDHGKEETDSVFKEAVSCTLHT